ncbi:MAG: nucleotidyltransferase domain-containing protein [Acidobacteriota bacterium]|jgi:predicted nucleotidyltransferase|nr:nucleotidyltransferase domain-containing protein [Acidobacteriota bacterium]
MAATFHLQLPGDSCREEEVEAFCRALVERYRPSKITMFGSYASGRARRDSDLDLLVEMEHTGSSLGMAATIVRETKPGFAVDILVRTPQQIDERIRLGDPFMIEIVNNGKVVYESARR